MRGRKPKTVEEHIRDGTFRADKHGHLVEVYIPPLTGEPPDCLNKYAKAEWRRLLKVLPAGHLTEWDRDLFMAYCDAVGTFRSAAEELAKCGPVPKRNGKEAAAPSVWLRVKRDAVADAIRVANMLGLTPQTRGRVPRVAPKPSSPKIPPTRPQTFLDKLGRPPLPAGGGGDG